MGMPLTPVRVMMLATPSCSPFHIFSKSTFCGLRLICANPIERKIKISHIVKLNVNSEVH